MFTMKIILWVLVLTQMPATPAFEFLYSETTSNRLPGSILTG